MADPDVDRGGELESEGNLAGAEDAYARADERGDAEGALFLGVLLKRRGELAAAETAYRRAEQRGDPRASCNLAVLLEERGDIEGAEAAYRRADAVDFAGGAYGIGQLLYARGDIEGSIAANRRADDLGDADAAFNLGVLLKQRGDLAAAQAAFGRAESRGVVVASTSLGRLLEDRGDVLGAAAAYRRAEEGGDADGAFNLGALLFNQNELDDAVAAIKRAGAMGHSGAPETLRLIAEELASSGEQTSAGDMPHASSAESSTEPMAAWQVNTALAEIDAVQDALLTQRSRLAQVWNSESEDVTGAEERIRAVDAALALRSTALREFLRRNRDFSDGDAEAPAPPSTSNMLARTSGGALTVRPEVDAAFDREIRAAAMELADAARKSLKGRARSRAAAHIDTYRGLLAALGEERSAAQRALTDATSKRSNTASSERSHAQAALADAVAIARAAQQRLPCHLRPWTDPIWQAGWKSRIAVIGSAQLYAGTLRPEADARLGDNAKFGTDVTLPLIVPSDGNLHVVHEAGDRPFAQSLVRSLLLRALLSTEAGKTQLTFFDPVGLGQSVGSLLELSEYDASLVGGKVWSATSDLLTRLNELTSHIELVLQKHLRSTYASIDEFNRDAGEVAEPYRYLVLFDFPSGFNDETFRELVRVIQNGPRCGVRTILVTSSDVDVPYGVNLETIASQVPRLVLGQPLTHEARDFSMKMSFDADSDFAGGQSLVRDIVDDVGRSSASRREPVVSLNGVFKLFAETAARGIATGVPPSAANTDLSNEATWWSCSTVDGIAAPIGRKGAREVAALVFDSEDHAGALLVGRPGSGKSTLLHAFIAGATALYGPEELELYLIDFKEGVEFEVYASESLPHARCIAIESDREFGLSVLQSLEAELKRRGELLRASGGHHSGLAGLRRSTNEVIPRVLLAFDEFHVLFSRNDKVGLAAADLLEQLIRQGRSFGIHVLLGSQSLAGLDALGSHVPQLLPVRILLPAAEADVRRVLGDANDAGQYLTTHGEGILNQAGGAVEANERFKGALQEESARQEHVAALRRLADASHFTRQPVVFAGNAATPIETVMPEQFSEELSTTGRAPLRVRIGRPMTIHGVADIHLGREAGSNILVVARDNREAEAPSPLLGHSVPRSLLMLALASLSLSPASLDVVDFTPIDDDIDAAMGPLLERARVRVHRRRAFRPLLDELLSETRARINADDTEAPPKVLALYGLHRARELDVSGGIDADLQLIDALEELVRDGPEVGIHAWIWCETVNALSRRLPSSVIREFGWRVAGKQSADDSNMFVGTESAAELREQQVLLANDDRGVLKRCTTFTTPTARWLIEMLDGSRDSAD